MSTDKRIAPPFPDQTFKSLSEWDAKGSIVLRSHPRWNNTEDGYDGWRGFHFTAICFDSFGRHCPEGGDFIRADAEGALPIWWVWPDQIAEMAARLSDEINNQEGV